MPNWLVDEARDGLERGRGRSADEYLMSVHKALTEAGIEFLPADVKGEGVRLATP